MKDIDFLPEWYKNGIRREVSYRTQYIMLGGVFLVMTVWSLATTRSISKAQAEFSDMSAMHTQAEQVSAELAGVEDKLRSLQKKLESTGRIDSRIDVASVLGEISFLIEETTVLKKLEFVAEKFPNELQDQKSARASGVVRAIRVKAGEKQQPPLGKVRFRVLITGVAADAGSVAALICRLEDSQYFRDVVLSFSQSAEIQTEGKSVTGGGIHQAGTSIPVSEFEISCYLANYRQL